jgi:PadR family transcriptional regulator, regulatory protein PadR
LHKAKSPIAIQADFFYKHEIMSSTELTTLEQHLLLAVIALHPNGYGVLLQNHIKDRTGREPSTGSIYASLDRLEEKGFVKSRQGEATAERGGKRKLHFAITAPGQHALRQSLQAINALSHGLRWKRAAVWQ